MLYVQLIYDTLKWKSSHKDIPQKMQNIVVAPLDGAINWTGNNQLIVSIDNGMGLASWCLKWDVGG